MSHSDSETSSLFLISLEQLVLACVELLPQLLFLTMCAHAPKDSIILDQDVPTVMVTVLLAMEEVTHNATNARKQETSFGMEKHVSLARQAVLSVMDLQLHSAFNAAQDTPTLLGLTNVL
jgi:hypothetical protein